MAKVKSDREAAIDAIIGEAVGEGRRGMIAVAHVINNRAMTRGKTVGQVARAPNQFDGYSNPGSAAKKAQDNPRIRAEAAAILDGVQTGAIPDPTGGADHFYSGSKKPGWADRLTKTADIGGHKFFREAAAPVANAVSRLSDAAIKTVDTVTAPARNVASALAMAAFPSVSRPSPPTALASYSRQNLTPGVVGVLDALAANPNAQTVGINSGYRSPQHNAAVGGAKHSQHTHGNAIDLDVRGLSDAQKTALLDTAIEAGAKGIGLYSSGNTIHVDTRANPAVWSDSYKGIPTSKAPSWARASLEGMMQAGQFNVTPRTTAPVPTSRPSAPPSLVASPSGTVTRSPLGPAAPRSPDPSRFAYDVTPPAQPGGFSLVSQANAAPMPNRPVTTPTTSRLPAAPAVARPSRPITPTPVSALAAMNKPAFPSALMSPTAIGVPQTLAPPQTVQPTFVPAAVPAPPLAPPRTIQQRPVFEAPQPAPQPRSTAMDVYNGLANEGFANDGSKITRDQFGGTSITNKFGVTTTTLANGKQATSRNAPAPGISGPLGGNIGNALDKTFTADPALNGRSPFGNFARQTGGRFAGAAVGSVLGPVGSILGSLIGQELAKPNGGKIGDFVNGVRTVNVMGQPTQFARAVSGGQFPNAPNVSGALGGRQSNRSGEAMRDISPAAARDISRGRGGLF
ncbi:D-Ala-D-Ala carboxypeptidase family metallohydrolase [Mesorhizobium sp. Root157]|uniref:D-Ala-D-Ala carboxypeptidase family metallohydrolase n=1 Tax=Mesorhizobium sp. Root157 TaxID=1736477 RepID=UPI0012E36936|nr:D-Ala-D-Ala carboxypeptidase family metallohydrolase [Mesorhizobium sp. Root157]